MGDVERDHAQGNLPIRLHVSSRSTHIQKADQRDFRQLGVSSRMLKNVLSKFQLLGKQVKSVHSVQSRP